MAGVKLTVVQVVGLDDLLGILGYAGTFDLGRDTEVGTGLSHVIQEDKNLTETRLTPYTCLAPALAANMERIPVPLPTSRTTLPLNTCLLWYMAFR